MIRQTKSLPSLPAVYLQLIEELKSPNASLWRVGELISQDVAMTAKLLQLVNSSFFGLPQHIDSPTHAATLLGLQNLKPLVFTAGVFSQLHAKEISGYSFNRLTRHSLIVSTCARKIVAAENRVNGRLAEDALLGGLMHDVGQIVMAAKLPQQYKQAIELAKKEKMPIFDAELHSLGTTHCDVGAYLLDLWGLPNQIVECVAFHHDPTKCPHRGFTALTAVHVADALESECNQDGGITYNAKLNLVCLETLGLTHRVREWRAIGEMVRLRGARS